MSELDIDAVIERLLADGPGKRASLNVKEMMSIIHQARELFMQQPMLIKTNVPIKICGDIHGQFEDLQELLEVCGLPSPSCRYLFLGDYVDRGRRSIECIILLLAYKIKYPNDMFLLRGNHEEGNVNSVYGFLDECKRRYSMKLWRCFIDCFNCMPVAGLVADRVFCCHGGLPKNLRSLDQITNLARPCTVPDHGFITDLLWSDPSADIKGWAFNNERNVSWLFGADVVHQFCDRHNLSLICRAHYVVEDGYEFFAQRRLLTIFSAPYYCADFANAAAVLNLSKALAGSFTILLPAASRRMRISQSVDLPNTKAVWSRNTLVPTNPVLSTAS